LKAYREVKVKRQTCAKLVAMGFIWSGFTFLLEYLATGDGQALDYTGQGLLLLFVWGAKIGGLVVAIIFGTFLALSYRGPTERKNV